MISVIISLYNKQEYIANTVYSVLNQSFHDFELIIVNDGSTDNSLNIVNEINDYRVKVLSKENGGVSSARNTGINFANGDYIFFLDADDIISSDCLSVLDSLISDFPFADVYIANFEMSIGSKKNTICKGKTRGYISNPTKSRWNRIIIPRIGNFIIRKKALDLIGFYKTNISLYEDLEFNIRMLSSCKVAYTPIVVLEYHRDSSALSNRKLPLDKEFCSHISLENSSYYKKLLLSDNINRSIFNRLKRYDLKNALYLLMKNFKHIPFLLYTLIFTIFR